MRLQEAVKPKKRVVAIYPGRLQPMGSHHFAAYQHLVDKFGAANVYIATSNFTGPKSPFTFAEKKKIIRGYEDFVFLNNRGSSISRSLVGRVFVI